jgi:hypothetical protein
MKITSDSKLTKNQINQIAAQIKWLKTQEANASQNNLPMYVKMFQNERRQLVKSFNVMIGSPNSVKGIQYGERRWLSNITKGFVKPYGRAVQILSVTK